MKLLVDHAVKRVIFAGAGYRMLAHFKACALCNRKVQLRRFGS